MGAQLAPYNNAMRVGQGFNSYTQQICLNDAVMRPSRCKPHDASRAVGAPGSQGLPGQDGTTPADPSSALSLRSDTGQGVTRDATNASGGRVSQIVSYSSRFVDKLSDVTDAMNISASLSIKTASIGGSASGSFIDSNKFKESDMNFFVQVKVVNQVNVAEDYTEFQDVLPEGAVFSEVYGDTYISGFEQGGELNALISVKVSDKNKTFAIRAELEATLGTPALSGKVKGGIDMDKSEMKSSTETTVTVNWSGGGQIKPTDAIWDVNSLTLAAANFPDLVAKTPQKTYAILSRYTSLKSFIACYPPSSVLTYENAGVYTSALLDMYMDYKSIWKMIQVANGELRNRRADIRPAKPSKEVAELALEWKAKREANKGKEKAVEESAPIPDAEHLSTATSKAVSKRPAPQPTAKPDINIPDLIDFTPYSPTVLGLDKAKNHCRNEMIKIVNEVDQITARPHLALDPSRENKFVSPRVFTQLLPLVTLRAVETDKEDSAVNPKDLLILGETDEAPRLQQWLFNRVGDEEAREPYPAMLASLDKHKGKCKKFDMGDAWCGADDPGKTTPFFNCLDRIDESYVPKSISVWAKGGFLIGLRVYYTNGVNISHGECPGQAQGTIDIRDGEAQSAIQLLVETGTAKDRSARVGALQFTLDTCKIQEFPPRQGPVEGSETETVTLTQPTNGFWSFRGFWGSVAPYQGGFRALGAVWGLDDPKLHHKPSEHPRSDEPTGAAGPDYRMFLGRALPEDALTSAKEHADKLEKYSMSPCFGDAAIDKGKMSYFNDLDLIKDEWRVKSVTFYMDKQALTGYIINYHNGTTIRRGTCPTGALGEPGTEEAVHWTAVRLGLSKHQRGGEDVNVLSAAWMKQFDGETKDFNVQDVHKDEITHLFPPDSTWSLAGFWGYHHGGLKAITNLGVVWAKRQELVAEEEA